MSTLINWARVDGNAAGWIAAQAGPAVLFEGDPGEGKSSTILQLAEQLGRDLILLIGSTHAAEDFSGIPFVAESKTFFDMVPPRFGERMSRPGSIVFCDEINTSPPSVQAAELSMFSERRLGEIKIHPDTLFFGACNPVHMAPNAAPLAKSMLNRFYHADWKFNFETYASGMETEDNEWGKAEFPKIEADWKRYRPKFGMLIVRFLRSNPRLRKSIPQTDEQKAFPTPRTWTYLRDCLAAAASIDAPSSIQSELCKGLVGDTAAGEFMRHMNIDDMIDAEAILDGRETFTYQKKRPDLAVCLLPALISGVKRDYTVERMDRAIECFVKSVGAHQKDLVFSQMKHLVRCKPPTEAFSPKATALIKELAASIPAALRNGSK